MFCNLNIFFSYKGNPEDFISMANDNVKYPNSKMVPKFGHPILISTRDIKENDEISYNYTQSKTKKNMPWRELKVI